MRAFIFDQYGYYPSIDDVEFDYEGWHFVLEAVNDLQEVDIEALDEFAISVCKNFKNAGVKIIKNRYQQYLSKDEKGNLILVAYKNYKFNINDLFKIHLQYNGTPSKTPYRISYLLSLWEEKISLIEEKIIPSFKIDDYFYFRVMVSTIHALGLGYNAIQYLAELKIDFNDEITPLTLTHRRLNSFEPKVMLDPLSFVLDSPVRDLAELFKAKVITVTELLNSLKQYSFSIKEISLLMARLLFPTTLFDLLEKHYSERVDVRNQILNYYHHLNEYVKELKYIEQYLVANYGIRPIAWLNEQ